MMKKMIYGVNPNALRPKIESAPLPVTVEELHAAGVAARKIPRVMEELERLVAADPALRDRKTLLGLAQQIGRQLR